MARKNNESEEKFLKFAKETNVTNVEDFVEELFLPYSWSVCLDRALVYIEDGLKPVHRRILVTANRLGLTDKSNKMKCATFDGEVMKLHPHGGAYGAILYMSEAEKPWQPRNLRVPLIKIKGNAGGLDTAAAAARYTEMNLWPAALELTKELNENAVDMVPNYDNTLMEPVRLPARWPTAFINGVPDAMAVGFACNIPCHNPDEVMDACIAYIKDEEVSINDLSKIIKGPDFNCGCDIIAEIPGSEAEGKAINGVKNYLNTGKGSFIMKAKYNLVEEKGAYTINFTALPYKVSPEKVIEALNKKYESGKFKELSSWQDLSDLKNPVNLEIVTKKGININKVIEDLYKETPLRTVFAANNIIVQNNIPQVMNVKEIISGFMEFRKQCTVRKLNFRLGKKKKLLSRQEGLLKVSADIDKCIKIIRGSKDDEEAKNKLIKSFKIDEEQSEYILSLQLRRLTKSNTLELKNSISNLKKEISEIEKILNNKKEFINFIVSELEDTKKVISSPRKCKIIKSEKGDKIEEEKDVYITYSDNKIKRSFEETENSYKLNPDGLIGILMKDKMYIRSIYEIPDNKEVPTSKFSCSGRSIGVVPREGYLLLVGEEGMMKIIDLSGLKFPKKDSIDKILPQKINSSFLLKDLNGSITIGSDNKEETVNLKDIPIRSITAGGKKFINETINFVEI